ncbi:MAG: SPOR domain-containing protein [Bacillota bacterium]|nr:SPOR domain-containing protein [Bacillota bacterium]
MRYTRYNLKKNDKGGYRFLIALVIVLFLSLLLGSVISNMFFGNGKQNAQLVKQTQENSSTKNETKADIVKFTAIQCGVFTKKENVDELLGTLNKLGGGFTVSDNNKYRVLYGIYKDDDSQKTVKFLSDNKVDSMKIYFQVDKNDECNAQIVELINAIISVFNKLSETDIKSVQTDKLKQWSSGLKKIDGSGKNIQVANELKDYIDKLPKEVSQNSVMSNDIFIYNELKKIK